MKYVAFLDILGFKSKLNNFKNHDDAVEFIRKFSNIVYMKFKSLDTSDSLKGFIVSDSVILYSEDDQRESLVKLMNLIKDICRAAFKANILIRGGLTKGEFDKVPAEELKNLEKGLIVGDAYIKAFKQESLVKAIGVTVSKNVKDDLFNHIESPDECIKNNLLLIPLEMNVDNDRNKYFWFKYIDIEFLLEADNLNRFIELLIKSDYLPHYYNTLYWAIKNEENKDKVQKLFDMVTSTLNRSDKNNSIFKSFIMKAENKGVELDFRFLLSRYIRIG